MKDPCSHHHKAQIMDQEGEKPGQKTLKAALGPKLGQMWKVGWKTGKKALELAHDHDWELDRTRYFAG